MITVLNGRKCVIVQSAELSGVLLCRVHISWCAGPTEGAWNGVCVQMVMRNTAGEGDIARYIARAGRRGVA